MKKIILNGCSWIAGDELVWHQYLNEIGRDVNDPTLQWKNNLFTVDFVSVQEQYRTVYRKKYNQGGMLAKELGTEVIDISDDGNSNDNIALSTINEVLSIPEEERQNYHVIVGWTLKERKLMYLDDYWRNVHISHCTGGKLSKTSYWDKYQSRFNGAFLEETDNDWYLNYFKNVILLESFLKSQNITFTFYRSLGKKSDFYDPDTDEKKNIFKVDLRNEKSYPQKNIKLGNFTPDAIDKSNWLTFLDDNDLTLAQQSWTEYMKQNLKFKWRLSDSNTHPNLNAIKELVLIIKEHLLSKNLLS